MKTNNYNFLVFFFLIVGIASAQIGIGTTNIDHSSVLDLKATNKGVLIPRMTTTKRGEILNPAIGLVIFNTEAKEIQTYNGGTIWQTRATGPIGLVGLKGPKGDNGTVVYISTASNPTKSGAGSTVAGGITNTASGPQSTVVGGIGSTSSGDYSTAIGNKNISSGITSTIAGGLINAASNAGASIGGGVSNKSSGANSTVVGGYTNEATQAGSTTVGGITNVSSGVGSTIVGGLKNTSSGVNVSLVGGGDENLAFGVTATVTGGGNLNKATGVSSVSGGSISEAQGVNSIVTGGINVFAPSFGEWTGGMNGTKYVALSATAANELDRAFSIGIGTSSNPTDLKEGLLILKNGASTLPNTSIALITESSDKSIITKEFLEYKQIKIIPDATYTLLQSDCDFILHFTNDDSVTPVKVYIPSGLKISTRFEGKQIGSVKISFVPETTLTVLHTQLKDKSKTAGQYSTFKMNWLSPNEYLLTGKLESITVPE